MLVLLAPEQHHYLANVMRLRAGSPVVLFNGRDGEWQASLAEGSGRRGAVMVERQLKLQGPEAGPWVVFAVVKRAALDLIVQKATELGAARLIPVTTDHAVSERINPDRLRRTAIEAAEQCERLSVPVIDPLQSLTACLDAWPSDRPLLAALERGRVTPLADALETIRPGHAHGLLTGPEGGFSVSELDSFAKHPIVTPVGLGPRILRAETAAISLLACYQAWAGDWRISPEPMV